MKRSIMAASALLATTLAAAAAEDTLRPGQPHPWKTGLQEALSPIEEQIHWFNDYTLLFIVPITLLVAGLLAWVVYRYNETSNPKPSRTSHNTVIEIVWTLAPVLVLLCIAIPSFQLLTAEYNPPSEPELTVKATGYQWYWSYEYQPGQVTAASDATTGTAPDAAAAAVPGEPNTAAQPVSFESYMMQETDRPGSGKEDKGIYPRLLTVDNELVVPVDTVIRVLSTSGDVIHSFALPSMGVKVDAIPGRNNEYWFKANREGIFYGQCSELCGLNHPFMPIALRVVSKDQYRTWLAAAANGVEDANKQLTAAIKSAEGSLSVAGR